MVAVFINTINSTSIPCMNLSDCPFFIIFYFLGTVAAYLTFPYIGGSRGFP